MDEFINSEPWWQSRINEIKSEGFNLDELIKKLKENSSQASVILEQVEKEFVLAHHAYTSRVWCEHDLQRNFLIIDYC